MRFGLILTAASIQGQIEAAQRAEARGFHSVWTTEFFHQHGFVRLAAVAGATERVRVGTAIAYAFMRTPMLAATAAMDIDEITCGRVILGLGSGTRSMNEKWYSMPFEHPPATRMREAVGVIRAAFAAAGGGGAPRGPRGRPRPAAAPGRRRAHAGRRLSTGATAGKP